MREGILTVSGIQLADGKTMSTQRAVDLGWVKPQNINTSGWGIERHEVPLGYNMMVDNGRQLLAYLFGGRTPVGSYVCSRFGVGTGSNPTNAAMTDLEAPLKFYNDGGTVQATKPINGIDFPVPFVARVEIALGLNEAVGTLITELGLYASDMSGGGVTLLARKTVVGVPKSADYSPVFLWRLRF